ncbi:hypothetical protein HDG37_007889 [Paraburkholderia sp. MM5384-R2]|nr:transposase [Paraburkholderia sp. MM5384-R2]MBB5503646.1 hypothetical protein [Paraburkholderia sp. MM5384-R2]
MAMAASSRSMGMDNGDLPPPFQCPNLTNACCKLRVHIEAEQQLWNECACLIAHPIIHYNTALLSRVHEHKRAAGDKATMAFIAGVSPVAWRHVNLFGAMDFGAATAPVDIDAPASYYADPEY